MSEFYITQREKCSRCNGLGVELAMLSTEAQTAAMTGAQLIPVALKLNQAIDELFCVKCNGDKFTETRVDADEWLLGKMKQLRWSETVEKSGNVRLSRNCILEDPRFEK